MEYYQLLEKQMIILTFVFAVAAAICGLLIPYFGNKKGEAAVREATWIIEHPNTCAIRFQFYTGNKDLGFLYATIHIEKIGGPINADAPQGPMNIIAKDSDLFFPLGTYTIRIETNKYKDAILKIDITPKLIGKRFWPGATLEMKTEK